MFSVECLVIDLDDDVARLEAGVGGRRARLDRGRVRIGATDQGAKIRLDEATSRFGRFTGQGNTPGLAAGAKFALADHPRADQNAAYTVLATQIDMQLAAHETGGAKESGFLCRFTLQRFDEPFRPLRSTRKPAVAGPQTAVVVGQGEPGDIVTDKYGRVKVQFHWDRLGAAPAG